jgi:hypothetical protein
MIELASHAGGRFAREWKSCAKPPAGSGWMAPGVLDGPACAARVFAGEAWGHAASGPVFRMKPKGDERGRQPKGKANDAWDIHR